MADAVPEGSSAEPAAAAEQIPADPAVAAASPSSAGGGPARADVEEAAVVSYPFISSTFSRRFLQPLLAVVPFYCRSFHFLPLFFPIVQGVPK